MIGIGIISSSRATISKSLNIFPLWLQGLLKIGTTVAGAIKSLVEHFWKIIHLLINKIVFVYLQYIKCFYQERACLFSASTLLCWQQNICSLI